MSALDSTLKSLPDLREVVRVLCAFGFRVRLLDASVPSDVRPTGSLEEVQRGGCRVVVTCTQSGLRAVLETVGAECRCTAQELSLAVCSQEDTNASTALIASLSEPVTLKLRECLTQMYHSDGGEPPALTGDLPAINSDPLKLQKQIPHIEIHSPPNSRRAIFGSVEEIYTSSVTSDRPLKIDDEIFSCPSSPVSKEKIGLGVVQSVSLDALSIPKGSGPFCTALSFPSVTRQVDNMEERLKQAASCIQDALNLHLRNIEDASTITRSRDLNRRNIEDAAIITRSRDSKKLSPTRRIFKEPNIPVSKVKSTVPSRGAGPSRDSNGKFTKPMPLTPLPAKKTKSVLLNRSSTPRPSGPVRRTRAIYENL